MWEEKEGVMRNAMTTRAPGGAKNVRKYLFGQMYTKHSLMLIRGSIGG